MPSSTCTSELEITSGCQYLGSQVRRSIHLKEVNNAERKHIRFKQCVFARVSAEAANGVLPEALGQTRETRQSKPFPSGWGKDASLKSTEIIGA